MRFKRTVVSAVTILLLAVQFGSSQFSPRMLRRFLRDPSTKAALGIFMATFIYALIVLRVVGTGRNNLFAIGTEHRGPDDVGVAAPVQGPDESAADESRPAGDEDAAVEGAHPSRESSSARAGSNIR